MGGSYDQAWGLGLGAWGLEAWGLEAWRLGGLEAWRSIGRSAACGTVRPDTEHLRVVASYGSAVDFAFSGGPS
jgi:hypothetical protein